MDSSKDKEANNSHSKNIRKPHNNEDEGRKLLTCVQTGKGKTQFIQLLLDRYKDYKF